MVRKIAAAGGVVRKRIASRKGAAMWVRVTVGLVILVIVLMVVGGALGAFIRSLAAPPEDHAKESQILMARAMSDVIKEGEGWVFPNCKKLELHLTRDYYIAISATEYGDNGEVVLEAIEDTDDGPRRVRAMAIEGTETMDRVCCHTDFDQEELCNNHCIDAAPMLIGKDETQDRYVCVCLHENSIYVYSPLWSDVGGCLDLPW